MANILVPNTTSTSATPATPVSITTSAVITLTDINPKVIAKTSETTKSNKNSQDKLVKYITKRIAIFSSEHADNFNLALEKKFFILNDLKIEDKNIDLHSILLHTFTNKNTNQLGQYWQTFISKLQTQKATVKNNTEQLYRIFSSKMRNETYQIIITKDLFKDITINTSSTALLKLIVENTSDKEQKKWKDRLDIIYQKLNTNGLSKIEKNLTTLLGYYDISAQIAIIAYLKENPLSAEEARRSIPQIIVSQISWDMLPYGTEFWSRLANKIANLPKFQISLKEKARIDTLENTHMKNYAEIDPEAVKKLAVSNIHISLTYEELSQTSDQVIYNYINYLQSLEDSIFWTNFTRKLQFNQLTKSCLFFQHISNMCTNNRKLENKIIKTATNDYISKFNSLIPELLQTPTEIIDAFRTMVRGTTDPDIKKLYREIRTYAYSPAFTKLKNKYLIILNTLIPIPQSLRKLLISTKFSLPNIEKTLEPFGTFREYDIKAISEMYPYEIPSPSKLVYRVSIDTYIILGKPVLNTTSKQKIDFFKHILDEIKVMNTIQGEEFIKILNLAEEKKTKKILLSFYKKNEDNIQRSLERTNVSLNNTSKSLIDLTRLYKRQTAELEGSIQYSKNVITKIYEQLILIREIDCVKSCIFTKTALEIKTEELYFNISEDSKQYIEKNYSDDFIDSITSNEVKELFLPRSLGEITILIPLIGNDIRFYSSHPIKGYWSNTKGSPHPHINTDGRPCWGSATETIAQLCGDDEFLFLVEYLLNYLNTVNLADAAGARFHKWPIYKV